MHDPLIAVVHLVTQDEYLSSKKCRKCKGWLTQVSPREKKCNSSDCSVTVVNRDDNAQVCALRPPPLPLGPSSHHPTMPLLLTLPPCPRCPTLPRPTCSSAWRCGWMGRIVQATSSAHPASRRPERTPTATCTGTAAAPQQSRPPPPPREPLHPGNDRNLQAIMHRARPPPPPSAFTHSTRIAPLFAPLTYTHAQQAHPLTPC